MGTGKGIGAARRACAEQKKRTAEDALSSWSAHFSPSRFRNYPMSVVWNSHLYCRSFYRPLARHRA